MTRLSRSTAAGLLSIVLCLGTSAGPALADPAATAAPEVTETSPGPGPGTAPLPVEAPVVAEPAAPEPVAPEPVAPDPAKPDSAEPDSAEPTRRPKWSYRGSRT